PKWTPASKSSGTNSVVSAIGENPRRGELQSGTVKMLQQRSMCNRKFDSPAGLLNVAFGPHTRGVLDPQLGPEHTDSNPTLSGFSQVLLDVPCQDPADI